MLKTQPTPDSWNPAYLPTIMAMMCETEAEEFRRYDALPSFLAPGQGYWILETPRGYAYLPFSILSNDGMSRITTPTGRSIVVDRVRCATDDPHGHLPMDLPGRLPSANRYLVSWRDGEGTLHSETILAGTRRTAHLFAGAPDDARIERL